MKLTRFNLIISQKIFCDNLSLTLVFLVVWLIIISVYRINPNKTWKYCLYIRVILLLGVLLLGVFISSKMFMFFMFFELTLFPTFFIIYLWGVQPERIKASFYFFLYTLLGSLPFLVVLFFIKFYKFKKTFLLFQLQKSFFNLLEKNLFNLTCFFCFIGFFIKMPIYGFHIWLTKAHLEAPVVGSMLLAGILLKVGAYGLLRMVYIFNLNFVSWLNFLILWCVVRMTLTRMICFRKNDLKLIVAYSSVVHMSLVIAGVGILRKIRFEGVIMLLIAHGITSSGLFWKVNCFYELRRRRNVLVNRGLLYILSSITFSWLIFCLCKSSLPPSLKFFSELNIFRSLLNLKKFFLCLIIFSVFLKGLFCLCLYLYVSHGRKKSFNYLWPSNNFRNLLINLLHFLPCVTFFLFWNIIFFKGKLNLNWKIHVLFLGYSLFKL